jgi:beta-glucosidase
MIQFPKDFKWGTSTSAYQIEGGWRTDGKGPSVWDAFCLIPGKIRNNESAETACDHYHRFKEDVKLMKEMGLKVYRFSIAWSRIMPAGRGKVNKKGLQFYSDLIDELIANDIEPWITLNHFDLPLALEQELDGWLNKEVAECFGEYARVCFKSFGDRVKHWVTFNEAWVVAMLSYGKGMFAPGRASKKEAYLAGHNILLAHAKAFQIYDKEFRSHQKGQIGITNNCDWREPLSSEKADVDAAQRALEFYFGWLTDPLFFGEYPLSMQTRLKGIIPDFTPEEKIMVKNSFDFIGLNHYTTHYAADSRGEVEEPFPGASLAFPEDQDVNLSVDPHWKLTEMNWPVVPDGLYKLLKWIDDRYDHPVLYITENGAAFNDQKSDGKVDDQERIDYLKGYVSSCHKAIQEGVDVRGYFVWSLLDNFEWTHGYSKRFGLHYVDFETIKRVPKSSALWYKNVIKNNGL